MKPGKLRNSLAFLSLAAVTSFLLLFSACQQVQESNGTAAPAPVETKIELISIPFSVIGGQQFEITWRISSEPRIIMHTAIHYDTSSHREQFTTATTPAAAAYKSLTTDYASTESSIPATFRANLTAPAAGGNLYFRAHAIIGGSNYWTEEQIVQVLPNPEAVAAETAGQGEPQGAQETASSIKEFTVAADDFSLNPSTITVSRGDKVKITFDVDKDKVYYGGLDFKGEPYFSTGKVAPGNSITVEFTAVETFDYKSYWPATSRLKATGKIVVN